MSNKCLAYSHSKLGLQQPNNKKAFHAGWDAAKKDDYALPNNLYDSKDWRESRYHDRVKLLHLMYESCKQELDRIQNDLEITNTHQIVK